MKDVKTLGQTRKELRAALQLLQLEFNSSHNQEAAKAFATLKQALLETYPSLNQE
ncbi:MAG: hypothetical protein GY799_28760 [Desulfobulbaceae bacterium]|nr:hypothetical protein [Desulfobulbaceae bacterium]